MTQGEALNNAVIELWEVDTETQLPIPIQQIEQITENGSFTFPIYDKNKTYAILVTSIPVNTEISLANENAYYIVKETPMIENSRQVWGIGELLIPLVSSNT